MVLKIRLTRIGRKEKSIYRIVVAPERSKQQGKVVDEIGSYNPTVKPPVFNLDENKYQDWLKKGAQPSDGLRKALKTKEEK